MKKELIWYGPVWSYSGYATHNRYCLLGLKKLGWKIQLVPSEKNIPEIIMGKKELLDMCRNKIDVINSISVNLVPPPALPLFGKYTVLYTTLESKTVHHGFYKRSTVFDEIWVPCRDNYRSMRKVNKNQIPLKLMPEGIDTDYYKPNGKTMYPELKDKFNFLFVGDWSYRKGVQWIIDAFSREFKFNEKVRLVMKTTYQGNDGMKNVKRIDREFDEIMDKIKIFDHAEIKFITSWTPDDKLNEFYNSFDCFMLLSCGEAWTLPAIQSLSCEVPVIITNWGGHRDYLNKKNSFLVKVEKYDTIHDKVNLGVDFYWHQLFGFPDLNNARKIMRKVFENQRMAKEKARCGRQDLIKNWTWDKAVKNIDRRLKRICRKLT